MHGLLKEEIVVLEERLEKERQEFDHSNYENYYKEKIKNLLHENVEKERKIEELEKQINIIYLEKNLYETKASSSSQPWEEVKNEDIRFKNLG